MSYGNIGTQLLAGMTEEELLDDIEMQTGGETEPAYVPTSSVLTDTAEIDALLGLKAGQDIPQTTPPATIPRSQGLGTAIETASDVGQAIIGGTASTLFSIGYGIGSAVSAPGGLFSPDPKPPEFYRNIITNMRKIQSAGMPAEMTPAAEATLSTLSLPMQAVQSVSSYVKQKAISAGLDEDRAAALEEAVNITGMLAVGKVVAKIPPKVAGAARRFRNAMRKNASGGPSGPGQLPGNVDTNIVDAEAVSAAYDLLEAAKSDPAFYRTIDPSKTILTAPRNVETIRPGTTATSTFPQVSPPVRPTIVDMKGSTLHERNMLENAGVISATDDPNIYLVNNRPRYVPGIDPVAMEPARPLQTVIDDIRDPETTAPVRKEAMEILKTTFRLRNETIETGLERLGFSADEITDLAPRINRVRSYRFKNYTGEVPVRPIEPTPTRPLESIPERLPAETNIPSVPATTTPTAITPVQPPLQTGAFRPGEEPPSAGTVAPVTPPPTTPTAPTAATPAETSTAIEAEFQAAVAALKADPSNVALQDRLKAAAQAVVLNDPQKIIGVKPPNPVEISPATAPTTTAPVVGAQPTTPVPTGVTEPTVTPATPTPLQRSIENYRAGSNTREDLVTIKTAARNAGGLNQLGFTADEIAELSPELSKVRTPRASAAAVVEPAQPAVTTVPLFDQKFHDVSSLAELAPTLENATYTSGLSRALATNARIKIGYTEQPILRTEGATPAQRAGVQSQSVLVDTIGVNVTTSLEDIRRMVTENKITENRASAMIANLRRQSEVGGVPIEQAHLVTPEKIFETAVQIAAQRGLQVYNFDGTSYVQVPDEIVQTTAKLTDGAPLEPKNITAEQAQNFIAQQTAPIGRDIIQEIRDALETGVDISDSLPDKIAPQFRQIFAENRRTLRASEVRRFTDILRDLATVAGSILPQGEGSIGPGGPLSNQRGVLGRFGLTDDTKLAIQRLLADAQRVGIPFAETLARMPRLQPSERALYTAYANSIKNPPPPEGMTPRNMTMTAESGNIVGQRVEGDNIFPPVYEKPLRALQEAPKDVRQIYFEKPYYTLDKYGLSDPFQYAYRDVNRSFQHAAREIKHDTNLIRKSLTREEEQQIAAFMYDKTPEGRVLNTENKVTAPASLNDNQVGATDAILRSYKILGDMVNEARRATGRPPMNIIDDYATFAREFTLAEYLGIAPSLITDPPHVITERLYNARTQAFPYAKERTGAAYRASYNFLDTFEKYATAVMRDYYISPFTAAISEMTNHKVVDLQTGQQTYLLSEQNPRLYEFMQSWTNRILGIPEFKLDPAADAFLRWVSRNVGAAYVSVNYKSALNQLGGMINTWYMLGNKYTLQGIQKLMEDPTADFKNSKFAMENSKLLDSRSAELDINDLYTAVRDLTRPAELIGTLNQYGTSGLRVLDMLVAKATWLGAYDMGIDVAGKMGIQNAHRYAVNYADDVLTRTQSSNLPGDLAAWQNSALMRAFTTLQNFTIANYNFLRHDVTGTVPGKYMKTPRDRVVGITQILIAQAMYDQVMGQIYGSFGSNYNGVFPNYTGILLNSDDKDRNLFQLAWDLAGETATQVPVLGAVKYGKAFGGPVFQLGADLKYEPLQGIGSVFGVPRVLTRGVQSSDIYSQYFGESSRGSSRTGRSGRSLSR
jgi:hypothetical protein